MPKVLPKKYKLGHNLSLFLHDLIADHVVQGERRGLLNFAFQCRNESDAESAKGLQGEQFWRWCEHNGYGDVTEKFSYINLIFGLTSDFCHFVFESLSCSERGKLVVAYSNLRKPLQDSLFYLEWILADRSDFMERFRKGPKELDLNRLIEKPEDRKRMRVRIMSAAHQMAAGPDHEFPDWLYELRYDKGADIGMDRLFNQALHLVTTTKGSETLAENVNFIFCDRSDLEGLWSHLYLLLPNILVHALHVVRALFKSIDPRFATHDLATELQIGAGFALWAERSCKRVKAKDMFFETQDATSLSCPKCRSAFKCEKSDLEQIWKRRSLRCRQCQAKFRL